jgi:hypothetical protein
MVAQVGYSVAGWSRGQVVLCTFCTVMVSWFGPQNQQWWFISGLASKLLGRFLRFGLKIGGDGFLVEPRNQGGGGFPRLGLKTGSYGLVIWASKSLWWFLGLGLKQTDFGLWVAP